MAVPCLGVAWRCTVCRPTSHVLMASSTIAPPRRRRRSQLTGCTRSRRRYRSRCDRQRRVQSTARDAGCAARAVHTRRLSLSLSLSLPHVLLDKSLLRLLILASTERRRVRQFETLRYKHIFHCLAIVLCHISLPIMFPLLPYDQKDHLLKITR